MSSVPVILDQVCHLFCFFFQAEVGIRCAQGSRGLGDVYKRQAIIKAALEKGYVHIIQNSKAKVAVVDSDYLTTLQEAYEDYLDHQGIENRRDEPTITLEEYLKKDTIKP